MNITTTAEDTTFLAQSDKTLKYHLKTKHFKSAMVQTWNKFCFTGGIIEVGSRGVSSTIHLGAGALMILKFFFFCGLTDMRSSSLLVCPFPAPGHRYLSRLALSGFFQAWCGWLALTSTGAGQASGARLHGGALAGHLAHGQPREGHLRRQLKLDLALVLREVRPRSPTETGGQLTPMCSKRRAKGSMFSTSLGSAR